MKTYKLIAFSGDESACGAGGGFGKPTIGRFFQTPLIFDVPGNFNTKLFCANREWGGGEAGEARAEFYNKDSEDGGKPINFVYITPREFEERSRNKQLHEFVIIQHPSKSFRRERDVTKRVLGVDFRETDSETEVKRHVVGVYQPESSLEPDHGGGSAKLGAPKKRAGVALEKRMQTAERVLVNGKTCAVFVGPRGGRYIKARNGSFVSLR